MVKTINFLYTQGRHRNKILTDLHLARTVILNNHLVSIIMIDPHLVISKIMIDLHLINKTLIDPHLIINMVMIDLHLVLEDEDEGVIVAVGAEVLLDEVVVIMVEVCLPLTQTGKDLGVNIVVDVDIDGDLLSNEIFVQIYTYIYILNLNLDNINELYLSESPLSCICWYVRNSLF